MLKLSDEWAGPARGAIAGAVATVALKGLGYVGSRMFEGSNQSNEELRDWDEDMEEVYLDKGPEGLARFLKRHDETVEDMDDAWELTEEFEEDNPRMVRRYKRRNQIAEEDTTPSRRRRRGRRRGGRSISGPTLND